jgi:hypothetical protein
VTITITIGSKNKKPSGYVFQANFGQPFVMISHKEVVQAKKLLNRQEPLYVHWSNHTPIKEITSATFAKRAIPKRLVGVNRKAEVF